jgi:Tfp pilus assembly protein PilX
MDRKSKVVDARGEAGAILILALVVLLAVGGVVGALVSLVGNDISNTTNFNNARSTLYAAESATELAIWNARISNTSNATPAPCPGASPSVEIDGEFIEDWCSTVPGTGSLSATRFLTVSACHLPSATGLSSICANPFLVATVTFDDLTNPGNLHNCSTVTVTSCGTAMTLNSWVVK